MSFISRSFLAVPVTVAFFVACSSSTTTPGTEDAGADASTTTDSAVADTSTPERDAATADATPDAAPPSCKNNGFTSVVNDGFVRGSGEVGIVGQSNAGAPVDTLEISLLPLTGNSVAAEKRTLTAADGSYDTCKTCLLIRTKCDDALSNCAKTFIATAGSLDILNAPAKGAKLEVKADVTMNEVTIDGKNVTTKVPNGETWCLTGQSFVVPSMQ